MPDLALTPADAARLWGLQTDQCQALFDILVGTGFLRRTARGAYVRDDYRSRTTLDGSAATHDPRRPAVGDAADWRCLGYPSRPNGLVIGPLQSTLAVVREMEESFALPVRHWSPGGEPWGHDHLPATLILHRLDALGPEEQWTLLEWLNHAARHVQVISLAARPVYALVRKRTFLEALYYRLNTVVVDCRLAPQSPPARLE